MNPSASGWIPKFLTLVDKQQITKENNDEILFYNHLKKTGFIYGTSIKALSNNPLSNLKITTDEYTKINLFQALVVTFFIKNPKAELDEAIDTIINFYKTLKKGKTSFLFNLTLSHSSSNNLEHILTARLQETNSILKKNISSILTYTLLYLDILTFKAFLENPNQIISYGENLENDIVNYCFLALKAKNNKDKYDLQIIEILETSTPYITLNNEQKSFYSLEKLTIDNNYNTLEKKYIFDLCCLAIWNDKKLDENEFLFVKQLSTLLSISENEIINTLDQLKYFSETYSKTIKLFEYSNPINQLYKQATETVKLLILRNKNRLIKELKESGELLKLLGQSTVRELNTTEKDKVKEQLLDICKTVPSLTIFLIPGGSLLLPLLVKYIPSLLPSAFQDNRIDIKKNKNQNGAP